MTAAGSGNTSVRSAGRERAPLPFFVLTGIAQFLQNDAGTAHHQGRQQHDPAIERVQVAFLHSAADQRLENDAEPSAEHCHRQKEQQQRNEDGFVGHRAAGQSARLGAGRVQKCVWVGVQGLGQAHHHIQVRIRPGHLPVGHRLPGHVQGGGQFLLGEPVLFAETADIFANVRHGFGPPVVFLLPLYPFWL